MSTAVLGPVITHAPTRPVEVQPHLQQVTRGHCTIVSIWPAPLRTKRNHNGITWYPMPAAPRGSYASLTVYDTQQWINRPREDRMQGELEAKPIPARVVAECLVATWSGDTLGARSGFKPGIGIIAGDEPTAEELAALRSGQSSLFNWLITDAMGKHMSGEGVLISDMHRMAAKEMLDKGAERLPWYPTTDFAAVKNCIACGKQINENAIRCEHCTTMLPDFYLQYGIDPVGDSAVRSFIERIQAAKAIRVEAKVSEPEPEKDPRTAGQPKK
jgi:hypothetical protein